MQCTQVPVRVKLKLVRPRRQGHPFILLPSLWCPPFPLSCVRRLTGTGSWRSSSCSISRAAGRTRRQARGRRRGYSWTQGRTSWQRYIPSKRQGFRRIWLMLGIHTLNELAYRLYPGPSVQLLHTSTLQTRDNRRRPSTANVAQKWNGHACREIRALSCLKCLATLKLEYGGCFVLCFRPELFLYLYVVNMNSLVCWRNQIVFPPCFLSTKTGVSHQPQPSIRRNQVMGHTIQ